MARKRSKRTRISIQSKYILLAFTIICVLMMVLSYTTTILNGPFESVVGYTIVPFQKGLSKAGTWLSTRSDNIKRLQELTEENEELKSTVADLTIQINALQQDRLNSPNSVSSIPLTTAMPVTKRSAQESSERMPGTGSVFS